MNGDFILNSFLNDIIEVYFLYTIRNIKPKYSSFLFYFS